MRRMFFFQNNGPRHVIFYIKPLIVLIFIIDEISISVIFDVMWTNFLYGVDSIICQLA